MANGTLSRRELERQEFEDYQRGVRRRPLPPNPKRPRTRGECAGGARPCPFVSCRYNLFLDVSRSGGIVFNHGDDVDALRTMKSTCALDVADTGPKNFLEMAEYVNITNEGVRLWFIDASKKASSLPALQELSHG